MRPFWPIALVLLGAGCGRQEVTQRTYREIATGRSSSAPVTAPSAAPAMSGSVPTSGVEVAWQTPEGWQEQPGSAMRLVTFTVDDAECTITAFPGNVGGLNANLERWLGQLNVRAGSSQALDAFVAAAQPVGGDLSGQLFDFGSWVGDDPGAPSMLAAVLEKSDSTVFVKMMGPQGVLAEHRDAFAGLCRSVR